MVDNRKPTITRRRLLRGVGIAGTLVLAGCNELDGNTGTPTPDTDENENDSGDTLTLGLAALPSTLDPVTATDRVAREIDSQLFDALYTYDEGANVVSHLATDEPEIDEEGTTYRITIVEDATFHNGDSVTADDVAYSIEARADETDAPGYDHVESAAAEDDRTLIVTLREAYAPFVHVLANTSIVPRQRAEDIDAFANELIGTGPFQLADRSNNRVRLGRWDEYWGELTPGVNDVRIETVEEPTTRLNNLRSSQNDIIDGLSPSVWEEITSMESASVAETPELHYVYLGFNCSDGPTADSTVREAVDYCVSFDRVVDDFVAPNGVRQYSPLPGPVAAVWDLPTDDWIDIQHEKDIERAGELFAAADVPDSWEPTLIVPPDELIEQLAIAVVNGLNEANYEATLEHLDEVEFEERHVTGNLDDYDMFIGQWRGLPDPDAFTHPLFVAEAAGETNGVHYENEAVDGELRQARRTTDTEERHDLYESAITTVLEERVHIPIFASKRSFGVRNYVQGFTPHSALGYRLVSEYNNVSIEE